MPALRTGLPLPAEKLALVDLLRVLLKACAARQKVAPRLIADGDDLERIAVEVAPDVPAMKGWRGYMFGIYAQRLKQGELALKADRWRDRAAGAGGRIRGHPRGARRRADAP